MEHWLIEKHRDNIELINMTSKEFRWKIHNETLFKMEDKTNEFNSVFCWGNIQPHYKFYYDFVSNEKVIKEKLQESKLIRHQYLLVETISNLPIIKVPIAYFIENWFDFIYANNGMGSILITEDYTLLMEFTDDYRYLLLSNFLITLNT